MALTRVNNFRVNGMQEFPQELWSPKKLSSWSLFAYRISLFVPLFLTFSLLSLFTRFLGTDRKRGAHSLSRSFVPQSKLPLFLFSGVLVLSIGFYFWKQQKNFSASARLKLPNLKIPIPKKRLLSRKHIVLLFPLLPGMLAVSRFQENYKYRWAKDFYGNHWNLFLQQSQTLEKEILLKELLGEGGQAKVYKASLLESNNLVVKINAPHPYLANSALQESEIMKELPSGSHFPTLKGTYILGRHQLGLLMNFVNGKPLLSANKPTDLSLDKIIDVAKQAFQALKILGEKKILHADVRLPNLLRKDDGSLCLIDFGMAHKQGRPPPIPRHIQLGQYRAPEVILHGNGYENPSSPQRKPSPDITSVIDVWSLGISLWELYVKKPLFSKEFNNDFDSQASLEEQNQSQAYRDKLHLEAMQKILGKFDKKTLEKSENWKKHIEKIRLHSSSKSNAIEQEILERAKKNNESEEKAKKFASLIEKTLNLDWEKRIQPKEALKEIEKSFSFCSNDPKTPLDSSL
jgi:serine/threonine protein kinase